MGEVHRCQPCGQCVPLSQVHGGSAQCGVCVAWYRTCQLLAGMDLFLFLGGYSSVCSLVQNFTSLAYKLHTSCIQVLAIYNVIEL